MANKIISSDIPAYNYNLGHISIDLDRKTAVLIRQSKKKSEKDHYEIRLLQENLIPLAMNLRGEIVLANILCMTKVLAFQARKAMMNARSCQNCTLISQTALLGVLLSPVLTGSFVTSTF